MSGLDALIARTGMRPDVVKRRVMAGAVFGFAVVAAQKWLGLGA